MKSTIRALKIWLHEYNVFAIQKELNRLYSDPSLAPLFENDRKEKITLLESRKGFAFQIIATALTFLALVGSTLFSSFGNFRDSQEFVLQNRPYIVISTIESIPSEKDEYKYLLRFKNVGTLPAKKLDSKLTCEGSSGTLDSRSDDKNIIGNGEELTFLLHVKTTTHLSCNYRVEYETQPRVSRNSIFLTEYTLRRSENGSLYAQDANLE